MSSVPTAPAIASERVTWRSISRDIHVHLSPTSVEWDESIVAWRHEIEESLKTLDEIFSNDSERFRTPFSVIQDEEYKSTIEMAFRNLHTAQALLSTDSPLDPRLKTITYGDEDYDWQDPESRDELVEQCRMFLVWSNHIDRMVDEYLELDSPEDGDEAESERMSKMNTVVEHQRYAVAASALETSKRVFREYEHLLKDLEYQNAHQKFTSHRRSDNPDPESDSRGAVATSTSMARRSGIISPQLSNHRDESALQVDLEERFRGRTSRRQESLQRMTNAVARLMAQRKLFEENGGEQPPGMDWI